MSSLAGPSKTLTHVVLDDREAEEAPLSLAIIGRLMKFTRPYAWTRNWLFVLVIVRSIQLPMLAWMLAWVISGPITQVTREAQENPDAPINFMPVILGAVGFALLAAFTYITFAYRQRLALELGENIVHDLRNRIFEHLQTMSMGFYDRTKVGRIISRMTSDAEAVRSGVQDVLFITLVQMGQMVGAAAVMLYYDYVLFGIILAMAPILWVITRYFRNKLSVAYREVQESFSRVTATLAESVSGIRVTQGFVRQEVNAAMFHDLLRSHGEYNVRAAKLTGWFLPLLELNSQFFLSVLLIFGGYQVLELGFGAAGTPEEQFARIFPFFFMLPQFLGPVSTIGRMYNQALTAMAGAERVFRLLDFDPEVLDAEDAIDLTIHGKVEFRDVTFAYDPRKPVLHGIDFLAEPGQTVALVGSTGSGKSTVIKLISKFYLPTGGELLVDDVDIHRIRSEALLSQLGIVLQVNFLFTGTVMENIRVGRADATDTEVFEAARKLGVFDLIESMPDGFYTQVGERGANMSLGQRQIVCFTRAMLANPKILILDEATSSVDTMTEARIQKALQVLLRGRTSFVVAHRLSTIRHADCVLVLEQGRIVERGTHTELLELGGVYANLYRQFIHATEA
jgi:ATP-binding cassette subfamily B protein